MKKHLYINIFALALLVLLTQTTFAHAEDGVSSSNNGSSTPTNPPSTTVIEGTERTGKPMPYIPKPAKPIREAIKEINDDRKDMNNQIGSERKALASSTASSTPGQKREDYKEFRKDAKDQRSDFRESAQEKLQHARLQSMVRIVLNRLSATITRLEKIVAKLDTRIAKFKEMGADVTVATKASADAKLSLKDARTKLTAIVIPTDVALGTATTTKESIRTSVKEVESLIRKAHKDVVEALKSFKGMSVGDPTATSTLTN